MSEIVIKSASYPQDWPVISTIRVAVFQEEQNVDPTLEFDGLDEQCQHFLGYLDAQVVATTRIRFLDSETAKIERVAVLKVARGKGIAIQLMEVAIAFCQQRQVKTVVVNAQSYIKMLYRKLGFIQEGDVFEEAGIPHVKMKLKLS